jgi:hypothetical protein
MFYVISKEKVLKKMQTFSSKKNLFTRINKKEEKSMFHIKRKVALLVINAFFLILMAS